MEITSPFPRSPNGLFQSLFESHSATLDSRRPASFPSAAMDDDRPHGHRQGAAAAASPDPRGRSDHCTAPSTAGRCVTTARRYSKKEISEALKETFFCCNECLNKASEPVLSRCGHLFCWPCLYSGQYGGSLRDCSVCAEVLNLDLAGDVIPIYGPESDRPGKLRVLHSLKVPPRPKARRIGSPKLKPMLSPPVVRGNGAEEMAARRWTPGASHIVGDDEESPPSTRRRLF